MITEYIANLFQPRASYQPWDDFWFTPPSQLGGPTASGAYAGPDTAMHISAFFNGVRILAETVAQPPLILYERLDEDQKQVARDNTLYDVLHNRPNAYQTSYEFRLLQMQNILLGGNAYAEILGERGVDELRLKMPGYMQVKLLASGRLGYMYREKGTERAFTQDEIFHVRGFPLNPDGITGQSLLTYARETTGLSLATENYGSRLFNTDAKQRGNYSTPPGIFLNPDQIGEMKKQINDSNGLLILQGGASWVATGMTAQDAEFLLSRKFQVVEWARFLNIQPHLLKDLDRATFSNIEHQGLEFLQFTMMPYFVNWEQAILRDLIVQRNRFFAEFLVDGLVRADIKTRYEAYGSAINTGFGTRNQFRLKENWNSLPGLDAPLVDQNKAMVDKNGKIVPINKPDAPAPQRPNVRREEEEAHYRQLVEGNASQVMRKEAKALARAWEKDRKDPEKLTEWADKFYAEYAHFVAEVMKLDETKAARFANDRRDKFILSIKDNCVHDHVFESEKYGPAQLVAFLNNGNGKHAEGA